MARYHQRWRVIQFSSPCSTPLDEINSTLKSVCTLAIPCYSFVSLRGYVFWDVVKERAMDKKGLMISFSFRLSCFSQDRIPSTEIPIFVRKKDLVIFYSLKFYLLRFYLFSSFSYIILFFFRVSFLSSCDIFSMIRGCSNWVETPTGEGEFNRESSVIDEARLHGTRSNNEFAARRMPPRIVGRPSVRDKIEKSRLYIHQGG